MFDLVEIARLLRDKGRRFTMSIVGEGLPDEIARLEELIRRYDLTKSVRLTGVLVGEEKFRLLRRTTIFLFPTFFRAETQPTALMEALAVGVPIVAYDWLRALTPLLIKALTAIWCRRVTLMPSVERSIKFSRLIILTRCEQQHGASLRSDLRQSGTSRHSGRARV